MSQIFVVIKRESGKYEEDPEWFSIIAAFDAKNKAKEFLQEYERTTPKKCFYTSYSIEEVSLYISRKKKIDVPKQSTYPIGEIIKLKIKS